MNEIKSKVYYEIDEDLIQSAVEDNLGRKLTEKELDRLPDAIINSVDFLSEIYDAVLNIAKDVMDENYQDPAIIETDSPEKDA